MENAEIAAILTRIAVYKELAGENAFKVRAFQNAARVIEQAAESAALLSKENRLRELPGIGEAIAAVIGELLETGDCAELSQLRSMIPAGLAEVLTLQGLGPRKVRSLWRELGVTTVAELEKACREGRVAGLAGFGEKTQAKILAAIEFMRSQSGFFLYPVARGIADSIKSILEETGLFRRVEIAGSLRRGKEVVKDADILVVPKPGVAAEKIASALTGLADIHDGKADIIGRGETKISLRKDGLQVDFRIVPEESFACAHQYFTGSKEHNTRIRGRAKTLGMKVNEYEISVEGKSLHPETEAAFYEILGLACIPPELREAEGEIEAAEEKRLPDLISLKDIKGVIHAHTSWSDGEFSLEGLAQECRARGYAYLGVSDHSQTARYAGGLSPERLLEQGKEIARLNRKFAPFRIFHGVESDILADGGLDYPDEYLEKLDFVIASVHSKLTMSKDEATRRLVAAVNNPHITVLGHPSGRLLLAREGYEYDTDAVFQAMAKNSVILEHNCHPARLDADWRLLKRAAALGVSVAINPDLHGMEGFDHIALGVTMARKAWLSSGAVINTRTAEEIDGFFKSRKRKARA